jgi:predicted GNAT family acetyltransferase
MTAHNQVTYNEAQQRYEMPFGNLVVYANVRKEKNMLYIDYVFAPQELRGKGAAGEFMSQLMNVVRGEKLKAVPICGYAASWLRRHIEYQDLVSDEYR